MNVFRKFVKIYLMNRAPLLLTLIFFVLYRVISYYTGDIWLPLLVFVVPVGLLILNLSLRKRLRYSSWFLSSINFLLERKKYVRQIEISKELLFDKLIEVIGESKFNLLDSNKDQSQLLCGTSINFWTWGENIYINLESLDGETTIEFTSTTLFGGSSWNRNQNNFESFNKSFETSLTI